MIKDKRFRALAPNPPPPPPKGSNSSQHDDAAGQNKSQASEVLKARRQKRNIVHAACDNCRKRKLRCDDRRPICGPCKRRGDTCNNDTKELELSVANRARQSAAEEGNVQLKNFYNRLHTLPHAEARQILNRLRTTGDSITILQAVNEASLLLPELNPLSNTHVGDQRLENLDMIALRDSIFRVDAKPWTAIAGDGIVSELISSFFAWDGCFLTPFIDRDAFLDDIRRRNPSKAMYCSPFLVNAICASRSYTSPRAKVFGRVARRDLASEFFNEAKRLLDLEQGRPSLPTVHGLTIMFLVSAYRGTDRQGMLFRFAAYDMFNRLKLDKFFNEIQNDPSKFIERRVISRAAWGLFCFESITAYVYLQMSMVPPPTMPRCFDAAAGPTEPLAPNIDLLDNEHTSQSKSPPMVKGVLDTTCDLCLMLYSSMSWNESKTNIPGSEEDLKRRNARLDEVIRWSTRLTRSLRTNINFTTQTCFLRALTHEVLISILRPLQPQVVVQPGWTAKRLCLKYAVADVDNMEAFVEKFTMREYSCMNMCGAYNSALIMAFHLDDPTTHKDFARACRLIRLSVQDFLMARFILQGLNALAWSMNMVIPEVAKPFFDGLGSTKESLRDVPLGLALPEVTDMRKLLTDGEDESTAQLATDMGSLLSKWSSMSVD